MNVDVKTNIGYEKGILEEATWSMPIYPACIGLQDTQVKTSPVCTCHTLQIGHLV